MKKFLKLISLFFFLFLIHPSLNAKTPKQNFKTLTGTITYVQQSSLGCFIGILSGRIKHEFIGDYDYCLSPKFAKGKWVKLEWKMVKIDNCEGGYGCGKYKDMKKILDIKFIKP